MTDRVNGSTTSEELHRWVLDSLGVELRHSGGSGYKAPREMVAEAHWQLAYMLEGELVENLKDDAGNQFHLNLAEGECSLRYFPRAVCLSDCSTALNNTLVLIRFSKIDLLGQGRLRREAEAARQAGMVAIRKIPVNSRMRQIASEVRVLKEEGTNGILPVLSNALAMLQQLLLSAEPSQVSALELEKQAIETACRILESRLESPPSLEELATEVGMSVTRFKTTFSRVCGMPPFTYLRDIRLERAKLLLQHEGLRVTEAALEVGYSNFSHFAKIFEARFGLIPSRFRQEITVRMAALLLGLEAFAELT